MKTTRLYQLSYSVLFLIIAYFIFLTVFTSSMAVTHGTNLSQLERQINEKIELKQQLQSQLSSEQSIYQLHTKAVNLGYIPIEQPLFISKSEK